MATRIGTFKEELDVVISQVSKPEWERALDNIAPKQVLAVGGPKDMELLPYQDGRGDWYIPIIHPVEYSFSNESPLSEPPISIGRYRIELLWDHENRKRKPIYVWQELTTSEAMQQLMHALVDTWIAQPYAGSNVLAIGGPLDMQFVSYDGEYEHPEHDDYFAQTMGKAGIMDDQKDVYVHGDIASMHAAESHLMRRFLQRFIAQPYTDPSDQ